MAQLGQAQLKAVQSQKHCNASCPSDQKPCRIHPLIKATWCLFLSPTRKPIYHSHLLPFSNPVIFRGRQKITKRALLLLLTSSSPSRQSRDSTLGAKPPLALALIHLPFISQHKSSSLSCSSNTPAALGYWKQPIAHAVLSYLHPCLLLSIFLRLCFPFNKEFPSTHTPDSFCVHEVSRGLFIFYFLIFQFVNFHFYFALCCQGRPRPLY